MTRALYHTHEIFLQNAIILKHLSMIMIAFEANIKINLIMAKH